MSAAMRYGLVALLAVMLPLCAAVAAPLTVSRTTNIVSDVEGNLLPKATPGAVLDYTISISNPNGVLSTVSGVGFADPVPAGTQMYVGDLGLSGSGPIVVSDGVLGLLGTGLVYSYSATEPDKDRLDFSCDGGGTWSCVPIADSTRYASNVTNVRIRFGGTMAAGSGLSIRLRLRVK